jgi:hypothetical protein
VHMYDVGGHGAPGPLVTWRRSVKLVRWTPLEADSESMRHAGVTIGNLGHGQESYAPIPRHY